jgi:hypothetical protein
MSEASKKGIVRLLTEAGEPNLRVQFLDACEHSANYGRKKGTTITFGTDAVTPRELATGERSMMGLIVWVPKADYERARQLIMAEV